MQIKARLKSDMGRIVFGLHYSALKVPLKIYLWKILIVTMFLLWKTTQCATS